MSFIRALESRRFSNGMTGMYVYPSETKDGTQLIVGLGEHSEDFVEILFRVLERACVNFDIETINRVRKELYLEPIKSVLSEEESVVNYFPPYVLAKLKSKTKKRGK